MPRAVNTGLGHRSTRRAALRVLFSCAGEYGHFHPLIGLARASARAGHEVAFAVPESFRPRAAQAGFTTLACGLDRAAFAEEIQRRLPGADHVPPEDRLLFALREIGVGVAAPVWAAELVALIECWRADVVVHGPSHFGAPLAAAAAGIPSVTLGWGILALDDLRLAGEAAAALWSEWGLEPEPFAGLFRHLYLDVCPPSLQSPGVAGAGVAHLLRPVPFDASGDEDLPAWVEALPDAPTVYVTLGTFYNRATELFGVIIEGLRDEPVNVVVTVGRDIDPAVLGAQPEHVHVERYIPVSLLLPHCDLVVTHGGAGTTLATLGNGLPLLFVPRGFDQFETARRCAARGVASSLAPAELNPVSVRREVRALLGSPGYGKAARSVQAEIAAMPGPERAVAAVERLVPGTNRP